MCYQHIFVTGISTAFWCTTSSNYRYQQLTSLFQNLMSYSYQKLILTLASQMMMTAWKFPVIIYLGQTIHLILNEGMFVQKLSFLKNSWYSVFTWVQY